MLKKKRIGLQRDVYVYFAQCNGFEGPVKIGFSTNVAERIADLQVGSPYPITLLGKFKCSTAPSFERRLHRFFAHLHMRGEWFQWSPEYKRLIDSMREVERIAGDRTLQVRITREDQ